MGNGQVESVIKKFLQSKKEAAFQKIHKDAVKTMDDKINKSDESLEIKEQAKKIVSTKKTKEQSALDSIKGKYDDLSNLHYQNLAFLSETKSDISKTILDLEEKYNAENWINYVAENASEVSLGVTHIAKLIHSSAKSSNISVSKQSAKSIKPILSTDNCLSILPYDFAYSDAKYAPVAEFLQLDCGGYFLGEVVCENRSVLKPYAKNDTQVDLWHERISLAFNEKGKSSHVLAKQVYFPINGNYHLLAPLVSSSMAQMIYDYIWQTRSNDAPARQARKAEVSSAEVDVLFHRTAIFKVTQTNHQNVSYLNGKRSGQLILLHSSPPQWQTQIKPPLYAATFFNRELSRLTKEYFQQLQNLLRAIKFNELSTNLQRKQHISALITEIADVVFNHVAQIHGLNQHAGWSQESKLPAHQQYWLDPFRADEEFQSGRTSSNWQTSVTSDFAKWVNKQLKHPKLTLGVAQEKHWKKLFAPLLREFNAISDAALDQLPRVEQGT